MGLLEDGQTIRGTYTVERFLGEGAFAEVYRVKHRVFGKQAMKVFKAVGMTTTETMQMLEEANLLATLGHPNIVRVFHADVTETSKGVCGFFTMEYVAGGSLENFWRSHGSQLVPIESSIEIVRQVCRGLAVAHSEIPPIVHRDVKPQNILVGYDSKGLSVKLSDFGLAKRVNPLTYMASTRGTESFKAPEALRNWQSDSCASDVWAIGSILYLLLTDRPAYSEFGKIDPSDDRRFERNLVSPSRLNIHVDGLLDSIVHKALAVDPRQRYSTAQDLLNALASWRVEIDMPVDSKRHRQESADPSKSALGMHAPANAAAASRMASEAIALAQEMGQLKEAADVMEEAFNHSPGLRERYEYRVKAWRSGKVM